MTAVQTDLRLVSPQFDLIIIGAGIIGLATAHALLLRRPHLRVAILEKERDIALHQTGHNSGVIHSGIYYKPGSLKAQLCVAGARRMIEFCERHAIPFRRIGKLVVATEPQELPRLEVLYQRARANGVAGVEIVDAARLREIEPHGAGLRALYVPTTAIVDYTQVATALAHDTREQGGELHTFARVLAIRTLSQGLAIETTHGTFTTRFLVNCAGLYSDHIAQMCGLTPEARIIPFRGEYYFLKPTRRELVRGLIYPLPDPRLPFLGVHFTRTIHGTVEAGPNAVLAFAREGYRWRTIRVGEVVATLTFPGFWRMARQWWRTSLYEFYRSLRKDAFVRSLQKLVPDIHKDDLERGGAGVRAQAVNARGELLDDFCFAASARSLHVLNAPSPAATASLAIGEYIASRAQELFLSDE